MTRFQDQLPTQVMDIFETDFLKTEEYRNLKYKGFTYDEFEDEFQEYVIKRYLLTGIHKELEEVKDNKFYEENGYSRKDYEIEECFYEEEIDEELPF